jgi:hypothetical protein
MKISSNTGHEGHEEVIRSRISDSMTSSYSLVGDSHACSISGRWVDDAERLNCGKCEQAFNLVRRRHHCRVCGNIFCNACSRTRMVLNVEKISGNSRRQRVCDNCALHAHDIASRSMAVRSTEDKADPLSASDSSSELTVSSEEDLLVGASETVQGSVQNTSFLWVSLLCFAGAFYFLKDEVSGTNPAIWILSFGFFKNVYELLAASTYTTQVDILMESRTKIVEHETHKSKNSPKTSRTSSTHINSSHKILISEAEKDKLVTLSDRAMQKLWEYGREVKTGWSSEPSMLEDVHLFSRDAIPNRIYKCETIMDLSTDELFNILYRDFESSADWNVTAADNRILNVLNENTDVVHLITKPALGGVITSRDFVNTRQWRRQGTNGYMISSTNAGNLIKPEKGVIRGENGDGGFIILPADESPSKCRFIWILNCDIKGYFPSSVLKKGSLSEMGCFIRNLRRFLADTNVKSNAPQATA